MEEIITFTRASKILKFLQINLTNEYYMLNVHDIAYRIKEGKQRDIACSESEYPALLKYEFSKINLLIKSWQTFSVKSQIENILGLCKSNNGTCFIFFVSLFVTIILKRENSQLERVEKKKRL